MSGWENIPSANLFQQFTVSQYEQPAKRLAERILAMVSRFVFSSIVQILIFTNANS